MRLVWNLTVRRGHLRTLKRAMPATARHTSSCGSEEGSYLRLIDLCITQLYAGE